MAHDLAEILRRAKSELKANLLRLTWLFSALLLASHTANAERQEGDVDQVVLAGEWISAKPQNVHFTLDRTDYFSGVIVFNCAAAEQKIRLTVMPSGADRVREISRDEPVRWRMELTTDGDAFSGELVGGGGRLPSILISPAASWLNTLGDDDGFFRVIIDETESYRLPTSSLISSAVRSCNPSVS